MQFGTVGQSHGVRGDTGVPDSVRRAINATDAPQQAPDHWPPLLAAYPLVDVYVVQRTRMDTDAPRAGMVVTTALAVPYEYLAAIALPTDEQFDDLERQHQLRPLRLDELEGQITAEGPRHLVQAVIERLAGEGRCVCPSLEDWNAVVRSVWDRIPGPDRATFVFGAAFHPAAFAYPQERDGLLLVGTSHSTRRLWPENLIADPTQNNRASALAEALFERRVQQELAGPIASLHGPDRTLADLRMLYTLDDYWRRLPSLTAEELRSAAQLVARFAPRPDQSQEPKDEVLRALCDRTLSGEFSDIRALGAVNFAAYGDGADWLDGLIDAWLQQHDEKGLQSVLSNALATITSADGGVPDAMRRALIRAALREPGRVLRPATRLAQLETPGATALFELVSHDVAIDGWLASVDDLGVAHGNVEVAQLARRLGLPVLHAHFTPADDANGAWRAQVAFTPPHSLALGILCDRVGFEATVRAALAIDDPTLTTLAGSLLSADHRLYGGFSASDADWRRLWIAAVEAGGAVDAVPTSDASAAYDLISAASSDQNASRLLDELVAATDVDLADDPRRGDVWDEVPVTVRRRLLERTALTVARRTEEDLRDLEPELAATLCRQQVLRTLAQSDPDVAVRVVTSLDVAEKAAAGVLIGGTPLSRTAADSLGVHVVEHGWTALATRIARLESQRDDLAPAAAHAAALLPSNDLIARIARIFSDSSPTVSLLDGETVTDTFWEVLSETGMQLFSQDELERLWERAGGDVAELEQTGSRRKLWEAAARLTRAGHRGAPDVASMLDEMIDRYPNNPELKHLQTIVAQGGLS